MFLANRILVITSHTDSINDSEHKHTKRDEERSRNLHTCIHRVVEHVLDEYRVLRIWWVHLAPAEKDSIGKNSGDYQVGETTEPYKKIENC